MDTLRISKDGWWVFREYLLDLLPFKTYGAMKAELMEPGTMYGSIAGQLPYAYLNSARRGRYVVYSYHTPIAWWDVAGHWVVPDVRYSVSTSRHQNKIRTALSGSGFYIDPGCKEFVSPWADSE